MARRRPAAAAARSQASGAAGRRQEPTQARGVDSAVTQRKLSNLVAQGRVSQALRVREQALSRHPDWTLTPSEAELWCLEGRQAVDRAEPQRAEKAFARALALLAEAFQSGQLGSNLTGSYLKLLLLQGEEQQVRTLLREQPRRFQSQQIHWAAGVLALLEGQPAQARRQFERMVAPASPGDHAAVWRAWALSQQGDSQAAAALLQGAHHPAATALALHLAAASAAHPATLLAGLGCPPPPQQALGLELLHHLRQGNHLQAADLLLSQEARLLKALPPLAQLRRPLLLLAGQQAFEQQAPSEAIRCWRPIVDRPAFDADLALRLYPLLIEGDLHDLQEAERLAGLLLHWLRRCARDTPAAWPEPLLSTTLARLHCWQADPQMRLGMGQQAHRSVEQARQLAPDLAEVTGCRGLLAETSGATDEAIPLLWQALEAGCGHRPVFHVLEEILEAEGRQEERRRLLREHGPRFGVSTAALDPALQDAPPLWLLALSEADGLAMLNTLSSHPASSGAGLEALRIFSDHVGAPRSRTARGDSTLQLRKLELQLASASQAWDALLPGLTPRQQVEALTAMVAAMLRFCRRGKALTVAIDARQLQLAGHLSSADPATADQALRALLLLLGLRLKRGERPDEFAGRLLCGSPQPERSLPLALLDLRLLTSTRPWQGLVQSLQRQDPDNPLLGLALATMERSFSSPYNRLSERAFAQARSQQDRQALAACRREQAWIERAFDRENARRRARSLADDPVWQRRFAKLDLKELLRRFAEENGVSEVGDADLEAMLPEFERQMREAFVRMGPEAFDQQMLNQGPPPPPPLPARRRRTFMEL